MPDRLLAEAAKMLRGMEQRFGIPAQDIETGAQERAGDDDSTTPGSNCPAGGHETDRRAS